MADFTKTIAVIQGAPGDIVQELLSAFVRRRQSSLRLAGVLAEHHGLADRACSAGYLVSLASGERFAMFQDLGPGSAACHLEAAGVVEAAAAVRRDIQGGCDLVVLSKFGKLEAARGGLRDAFSAAIEAGVPVLTTVARNSSAAWEEFAAPLYEVLPPTSDAIDAWWRAVGRRTPGIRAS